MKRGLTILLGVGLVVFGATVSVLRLHVDGLSCAAIAGLVIIALANRWPVTST